MKKGIYAVLAILTVFALVLGVTSCGGDSSSGPKDITITFDLDGGTLDSSFANPVKIKENSTLGDKLPGAADITKAGSTFKEWQAADGKVVEPNTKLSKSQTLKAIWAAGSLYTVTFDLNGGSGTAPAAIKQASAGAAITLPPGTGLTGPTDKPYFGGWSTTATGTALSGTTYTPTADIKLFAVWSATKVAATVTYDGNGATGGTVPASPTDVSVGDTITLAGNTGNLVKTGFTWDGWSDSQNGTKISGNSYVVGAATVTLYAVWKADDEPVENPLAGAEKTELKNGLMALYYFELPEGGRWDNYTKITVDYLVDAATLTQENGVRGGPRLYGNYNATTWAGFKAGTLSDGRKVVYAEFSDEVNAGNGQMILDNGALGSSWGTVASAAETLGVTVAANEWFTFSYVIDGTKKHTSYKEEQNKPAANATGPFVFGVGLSGDGVTTSYIKNVTLVGYEAEDSVIGKALYFTKDNVEMPAFAGYSSFSTGADGVIETKRSVVDATTPKKVIAWTGDVAGYEPPPPPPPPGEGPKYWDANEDLGDLVIDNAGAGWTNLEGDAFGGNWSYTGNVKVDLSTALTAAGKTMADFSHITAVVTYYDADKNEIPTILSLAQAVWTKDLSDPGATTNKVKDHYNLGWPNDWINAALPTEVTGEPLTVGFAVQKANAAADAAMSYIKIEKVILYLKATDTLEIDNDGDGWTNLEGDAFGGNWSYTGNVKVDLSSALTAAGKTMADFSHITAEVTYYNADKEEIPTILSLSQGVWTKDLSDPGATTNKVKDHYNLGWPSDWIRAALPTEVTGEPLTVGFAVQKANAAADAAMSYIKIDKVILYKFE
jgi:uncharacterized repeat protein (TIGR02543 family)